MDRHRRFQSSGKFGLSNENLKKLAMFKKGIEAKQGDRQISRKSNLNGNSNKKDVKMSYEIVKDMNRIGFKNGLMPFLKWNYVNVGKLGKFKDEIKNNSKSYPLDKSKIEKITGLFPNDVTDNELRAYVDKLIPYSFILHAKIELKFPYFSRDDDEFYLIQNPCLKEKVFKVPMVRGSGWKGIIAKAFRELINKKYNKDKKEKKTSENDANSISKLIQSYLRIFGTGSNEFRKLEETIKGFVEKGKSLSKEDLIKYLLFELGFKLTREDIDKLDNENEREQLIRNKFLSEEDRNEKNSDKNLLGYIATHKGRVIFYPTYFGSLSLEIINPHSRKTRAGTTPIHYEVVPEGSKGILQIVYIPFDGILMEESELKIQVEDDIDFLTQAIEKAREIGVGAKEKLGWGRFRLTNKRFCVNRTIGSEDINGWKQCEVNDEQ